METAADAVQREILEELGVELTAWTLLEVLEAFIDWQGAAEHEIVFFSRAKPTTRRCSPAIR